MPKTQACSWPEVSHKAEPFKDHGRFHFTCTLVLKIETTVPFPLLACFPLISEKLLLHWFLFVFCNMDVMPQSFNHICCHSQDQHQNAKTPTVIISHLLHVYESCSEALVNLPTPLHFDDVFRVWWGKSGVTFSQASNPMLLNE